MTKSSEKDYSVRSFPLHRKAVVDIMREGKKRYLAHGFHEVEVNVPKKLLAEYRARTGIKLSFTAFLVKCIAQAVSEYPEMASFLTGIFSKRMVTFHDVDVAIFIERCVEHDTLPLIYVIRAAQTKTIARIQEEINQAQTAQCSGFIIGSEKEQRESKLFYSLPEFIRKIVWWIMMHYPRMFKNRMGTVTISSVGMFESGLSFWQTTTVWPLAFFIGGIGLRSQHETISPENGSPISTQNKENSKVIGITTCIDHIIVDGAPSVRFLQRVFELIRTGFGLTDQ